MVARTLIAAALAAAFALTAGCSHNVGDSCSSNVDCSPLGDRFCDVSAPSGYCTIEGCDVTLVAGVPTDSCPTEAVCVRFFAPIAGKSCDPMASPNGCALDERCLCDRTDPNHPERCLAGTATTDGGAPIIAHCAPESSERRDCMRLCSKDGDCRQPDYECRQTGTDGAEPVPRSALLYTSADGGKYAVPNGPPASFCVQRPLPSSGTIPAPVDGATGG